MAGLKVIIDTISPWRGTRSESPAEEKTAVRHESRVSRPWLNLASGQK
jgi:hypothetical protein